MTVLRQQIEAAIAYVKLMRDSAADPRRRRYLSKKIAEGERILATYFAPELLRQKRFIRLC